MQAGASVNLACQRCDLASPLHTCAQRGKIQSLKTLLDYGANVFLKDKLELTARHRTIQHRECEKLLQEKEGMSVGELSTSQICPARENLFLPLLNVVVMTHKKCISRQCHMADMLILTYFFVSSTYKSFRTSINPGLLMSGFTLAIWDNPGDYRFTYS